jgi:hypothetical protein
MSLVANSARKMGRSWLGLFACGLAACATAQTPDDSGGYPSGPGNQSSAGSSGVAGAASAGTSSLPIAGTTAVGPTTGGTTTGTGGPSAGGTVATGTAGSVATTGTAGSVATTGGTSAGTCPPYTGALAKDSMIFTAGFGTATTGTWSGYAYTYKYGTATISPGTGTGCFAAAKLCANGSVPADDKSGAGLGWNIAQAMGASTMSTVAVAKPVVLKFAGVTAGMRVQLSASATVSYCYTLTDAEATAGTATIPLASFKTECWGTTGTAYDGVTKIEAIQIAVPGSAAGTAKTFDMCLLDVEPGP